MLLTPAMFCCTGCVAGCIIGHMPEEHSYDPRYFTPLLEAEDRYFWFRIRNQILSHFLTRLDQHLPEKYQVLEIGSGTGNTLRVLESACKRGQVTGSDLYLEGLTIAQKRVQLSLVQADIFNLPFSDTFDLICLFDVLEHLPNDSSVLQQLSQSLHTEGRLFLTVPADPDLWSYFDDASHHVRRYTYQGLQTLLIESGFTIETLTAFMNTTYPFLKLQRTWKNLWNRGKKELSETQAINDLSLPEGINQILYRLLLHEVKELEHGKVFKKGSSLLLIAKKSTGQGSNRNDQINIPAAQ